MVKHCELGYSLLLVQELQLVFAVKHTNLKSSSNYLTKMEKKKKKKIKPKKPKNRLAWAHYMNV